MKVVVSRCCPSMRRNLGTPSGTDCVCSVTMDPIKWDLGRSTSCISMRSFHNVSHWALSQQYGRWKRGTMYCFVPSMICWKVVSFAFILCFLPGPIKAGVIFSTVGATVALLSQNDKRNNDSCDLIFKLSLNSL